MDMRIESFQSLIVFPKFGEMGLGSATGFVVKRNEEPFFVTNWHVVSGRDWITGQPVHPQGAIPDRLHIMHGGAHGLGSFIAGIEPLYGETGEPLWREHPTWACAVDLAVLPLTKFGDGYTLRPHMVEATTPPLRVASPVSIVGFPSGITGGAGAVWSKGWIATEPQADYRRLPCFLVDSRTRQGQSGSPVLAVGEYKLTSAGLLTEDHSSALLGVYSGRVNDESDLGHVWKHNLIPEILTGAVSGRASVTAPEEARAAAYRIHGPHGPPR